jgi:inner membrane protein
MESMEFLRWAWTILAVIFFLGEIFTAGFVLACFGVGAAIAAILAFLNVNIAWQLVAFIVISTVAVWLSKPFADKITGKQAQGVGVDRVLNKIAIVTEEIDPVTTTGKVRVEREIWRAEADGDVKIPVQAKVIVTKVLGTRLQVKPYEENKPSKTKE